MKYINFITMATLTALLGAMIALSGCTSLQTAQDGDDQHDPFEGFNRSIFSFNEGVDRHILKPVAISYKNNIPQPVRTGVSNFFSNLAYPTVVINDVLQGKFSQGMADISRFVTNTIFGVAGIFDVATRWELPAHKEDFGQTFAMWGIGEGPYLVLPLLGPSNPRDGVGSILDYQANIISYYQDTAGRNVARSLNAVDERSNLLSAGRILDQAAFDPYIFTREAYRQRRLNLIYDGNPPQQDFFNDPIEDSDFDAGPPVSEPKLQP
ncbi:MAG: VacJ family lipoprotein [Gammaproteobacteria bacterium]